MKHVRVVDLTQHLSGPYCTWTLASLGAEVIKVEAIHKGDSARETSPFVNGKSIYFESVNRCKKSLAVDLKTEAGKQILTELLKTADVLVENFRPGVRARLGFSDEALAAINPRLITASISGFGQTGSHAEYPAYDIIAQAMSGVISVNGEENTKGVRVGFSIGDIAAGMFATIGILHRLYERDAAGQAPGAPLDISMVGCQVALLENAYARHLNAGDRPAPMGSRHPSIAPFESYAAADGHMVIALGSNADWPRFCSAIGADALTDHPQFLSTELRLEHRDALSAVLERHFATGPVDHWLERMRLAKIACAPLMDVAGFAASAFAQESGAFVGLTTDATRRFSKHPLAEAVPTPPAPLLGEHSRQVLINLGYEAEQINVLEAAGVVQSAA
ncbi:CaiB/BaiF CoA-transferase family protein [Xinfangfangia sp. CPCC 101601]|uniref:CaiB/BaiF CoA-transferase family protein n=1 Tax=Pseudogemmobacter lacusdianii TaxID=3069608 RepID=A0ABU0W169_9RHOB|nr:CaiB/BaiF CoA-transferase family protein [Xinfangfangia sp. CPCC 101601]MDQ2067743.1 CaiB/BaiF CoA-transferase family protein [Xinfangfangia sp. CPCC 101601]